MATKRQDGTMIEATPADPESIYRQRVREAAAGVRPEEAPPANVLEAADRLPADFPADVARLQKRLRAAQDLEEAARLEREADAVSDEQPIDKTPLQDFLGNGHTLGDLARAVADVLEDRAARRNHQPTRASSRRHEIWRQAFFMRSDAERVLVTTADPMIDEDAGDLALKCQGVEARIRERQSLIELPARVKAIKQAIDLIADGHRPAGADRSKPIKQLYKEYRQSLKAMLAQLPAAEAAAAANKADEERLARLRAEQAELLRLKMDPERGCNFAGHEPERDVEREVFSSSLSG